MKDIRPALRSLLLADPVVNSLVGGDRIKPVRLPQGDRGPSIVYHRVTGLFDYTMDGPSGLVQTMMQFDSVAINADTATLLANSAHDVLSGFRGQIVFGTGSPQESIVVHGIFQINDRDVFDPVTELLSVQRDYNVWYWET